MDSVEFYLHNAHGDVIVLTNGSGAVTKRYSYDAFGNEETPSTSDTNPFRYCGEYFDKETGTYYLRARYYDPAIGRFTQQDSLLFTTRKLASGYEYADPLSLNLYAYCYNNPVAYLDPSGHIVLEVALSTTAADLFCSLFFASLLYEFFGDVEALFKEAEKEREQVYTNIKKGLKHSDGSHTVYVIQSKESKKVVYVGRTMEYGNRKYHHTERVGAVYPEKFYDMYPVETGLTYEQARIREETLIMAFLMESGKSLGIDALISMSLYAIESIGKKGINNRIHSIAVSKWKSIPKWESMDLQELQRFSTLLYCLIDVEK